MSIDEQDPKADEPTATDAEQPDVESHRLHGGAPAEQPEVEAQSFRGGAPAEKSEKKRVKYIR
jgi:hypothetical protein